MFWYILLLVFVLFGCVSGEQILEVF